MRPLQKMTVVREGDDIKIQLDNILEGLENAYPQRLRGLLPRIYAGSNLDADNVRGLINLFSKDIFSYDQGGEGRPINRYVRRLRRLKSS